MFRIRILTYKRFVYLAIFIAGCWQFGSGTYIYAKAHYAQYLLDNAWSKTVNGEEKVKPWSWADTYPVAKISFSHLEKELIILAGSSGRTMAFAPGHVSATPLPGEVGNSVIVGHRDTHFSILKELKQGHEIHTQIPNKRQSYKVMNTFIVDHSEIGVMEDQGEDLLTLITCYPFDTIYAGGPLRYVVQAAPIGPDNKQTSLIEL